MSTELLVVQTSTKLPEMESCTFPIQIFQENLPLSSTFKAIQVIQRRYADMGGAKQNEKALAGSLLMPDIAAPADWSS